MRRKVSFTQASVPPLSDFVSKQLNLIQTKTMYSGVLLIFCSTLVIVKSYPTLIYDYYSYNPNIGNVKEIEFQDEDYLINDIKQNEDPTPCLQNQNGDVKCFFNNGLNGKLLPDESTGTAEYLTELEQDRNSVYEQNLRNLENSAVMEVVPPANPNYNVYHHDNSPKRYSTYIHGLIPPQDPPVMIRSMYLPENRLPYNRPARRTQSYDDFLAQLSHDAMMNNILPTMPYLRTPGGQGAYGTGSVPVQAAFPHAVSGCSQPVLVGCSPVISQGYISHVHDGYPYVKAPQIQVINPYNGYAVPSRRLVHNKVNPAVITVKQDFQKELTESVPVDNA